MQRFKITFIDQAGHCHRGTVPGANLASVLEQLEQQYGEPTRLACIRLPLRPDLHLVHPHPAHAQSQERRPPCVS